MKMAKEYFVPRAVLARFEFFPGFGVPELVAVLAGGALGMALQWVVAHLPMPPAPQFFLRAFLFVVPPGAGFMLMRPDFSGFSQYDKLRAARAYASRPRWYLYRFQGVRGSKR